MPRGPRNVLEIWSISSAIAASHARSMKLPSDPLEFLMDDHWLHSTKYDGSLHYRYPVHVVDRSGERLVTVCHPGKPVKSYRGAWIGKRHILSHFWRRRPYVLHVVWDSNWSPEFLYVDIATAAQWRDGNVSYIDLDLDLIVRPGAAAVHLDDAEEFEAHRVLWNYPEDLVNACWTAVEEVRGLFETGKEPFALSMFAWRPGQPLNCESTFPKWVKGDV